VGRISCEDAEIRVAIQAKGVEKEAKISLRHQEIRATRPLSPSGKHSVLQTHAFQGLGIHDKDSIAIIWWARIERHWLGLALLLKSTSLTESELVGNTSTLPFEVDTSNSF
jgi:hypothetical protein